MRVIRQGRFGRADKTGCRGGDRLFKRAAEVDRLVGAQRYIDGVGQGTVGKGILLAGGHRADESLSKGADDARYGLAAQLCLQFLHIDGGVAVKRRRIVFHCAQVPSAGVILRRTVVDGGEIIIFVLHGVGGDAVRHLCGGVVVQRRVAGYHAAKQHHIHRRRRFEGVLVCLLIVIPFDGQPRKRPSLGTAHEEQGVGILILLDLAEPCQVQGILRHLFCILPRRQGFDLIRHQPDDLFGAVADLLAIEKFLPEHQPHRPLPGLGGNTGAGGAAVDGGFGAAGIVPVDAAGRHGLQYVKINIQAFGFHSLCSFSFYDRGKRHAFSVSSLGSW